MFFVPAILRCHFFKKVSQAHLRFSKPSEIKPGEKILFYQEKWKRIWCDLKEVGEAGSLRGLVSNLQWTYGSNEKPKKSGLRTSMKKPLFIQIENLIWPLLGEPVKNCRTNLNKREDIFGETQDLEIRSSVLLFQTQFDPKGPNRPNKSKKK